MLKGINWTLVVITLLTYVLPFIPPKVSQPILFLGLFHPWLLLFNLIFVFYWVTDKTLFFLVPFFTIVLGYTPLVKIIGFNFSAEEKITEKSLTVASYNIHYFKDYYQNNDLRSSSELFDLISEVKADILCIQEFPRELGAVEELSENILLHSSFKHYNRFNSSDLVIFSRYPIKSMGGMLFSNGVNGFQVVEINLPDRQKLKIINTHLASNEVSVIAEKIATQPEMEEEEKLRSFFGMLGHYGKSSVSRVGQIQKIMDEIEDETEKVVVAGDFNEIPQSYIYRQIGKKLKDTFVEAGLGLGFSYNGKIPGLRIDYIFCSSDFEVSSSKIFPSDFSDHKLIIAKLIL